MKRVKRRRKLCTPLPGGYEYFSCRVSTDSMMGDGILAGEVIVVRQIGRRKEIPKGAICVVEELSSGKWGIGRPRFKRNGGLTLLSSNRHEFYDADFAPGDWKVVGYAVRHEWDTADGRRIEVDL